MRTYFIQFIMCIFEAKICDALYANHIPRKVHKPDYQLERLEVDTQKIVGSGFHPIKDWISSPFIGLQTVSLFQNILRIEFGYLAIVVTLKPVWLAMSGMMNCPF